MQKILSHPKIIAEHLGATQLDSMEKDDVKDLVE